MVGTRVLVTGASSGIGAEAAHRLAQRGADVVLVARGRRGLARTAAAVRDEGARAVVAPADVTDRDAVRQAVQRAVQELGGLDAVIVNAGAASYGEFRETPVEDVHRAIDVTLGGAVNVIAATLPQLERSAGTLVVTGSVAGLQPMPLMAGYSAAKHGLRGLVNSLRLELQAVGSQVRVALVHPGPVDTPFWRNVTPAGPMPPDLPFAYRAEDVARALVDAVAAPRPERTVGLAMRALGVVRTVARPLSDLGLVAAAGWALRRAADTPPGRALWEAAGEGDVDGPIDAHIGGWPQRLLAALRDD
jgi:short-subunit dehydrogenase